MNYWHQIPIVRLIIPFVAGILLAIVFEYPVDQLYFVLGALILIYIVFVLKYVKKLKYNHRWIVGIFQNLIFLIVGYCLLILNINSLKQNNISHFYETEMVHVKVVEQISEKENSFKVVTKVKAVKDSSGWKSATGILLCYFQKDALSKDICFGDELLVSAKWDEIKGPRNPGEFNYKRYLKNKGIYHQAYVRSENWECINNRGGFFLKAWGVNIRQYLLSVLNQNSLDGKEYAIVSAILLGYDDYLDAEQKQQFAAAGAMHILCVSGLHVGIIYYVLNLMLTFLKRKKILRIFKLILVLSFIWLYASITGFSPSVLRASTMFSCIAIGMSIKRKINIFNMLAASAFILILFNPFIITEVGFQLSYIAVVGILLLYKPIYNVFISRFWLVDKIWQITVVSIAATIATFPLSIFYFHQFPRLFLVTNLVAIPSAMIIIYMGIFLFMVSPFSIISMFVGKVLSWVIWVLNYSVSWIEGLSFSTSSGLLINRVELLLLYGIITSIVIIIIIKRKTFIWLTMLSLVVLFFSISMRHFKTELYSGFIVYSLKNATAIDFISNSRAIMLADSNVFYNAEKYQYNIDNCRINYSLDNVEVFQLCDSSIIKSYLKKSGNFIFFKDKTIVVVDQNFKVIPSSRKFNSDFVIFSQNASFSIAKLLKSIEFEFLVIDPSNSFWKVNRIKEECKELNIPYYCVPDRGAWVYNHSNDAILNAVN